MIEDKELCDLFKAESEEYIQDLEQGLLLLEKNPNDRDNLEKLFRDAHSMKGAARILALSDIETFSHQLEDHLRRAYREDLSLNAGDINKLYTTLDIIKALVDEAITGRDSGVNIEQAKRMLVAQSDHDEGSIPDASTVLFGQENTGQNGIDRPESFAGDQSPKEDSDKVPVATYDLYRPPETPGSKQTESESGGKTASGVEGKSEVYRIGTIRVPPKQLDTLMTHSGELSVTRTRINRRLGEMQNLLDEFENYCDIRLQLAQRYRDYKTGSDHDDERKLLELQEREVRTFEQFGHTLELIDRAFIEDQSRLDAVATRIEEGVASIRMLPLSNLFSHFPRMVRDIAQQEDKEIRLVIEGAETKVDKRMLEELKSPLTHIIRNAIHHGIEQPEAREAMGKRREGSITLRGYQVAARVVIEVTDDGNGLDAEEIKRKAIKEKLLPIDEIESLSEGQLQSLIFYSGFTTQEIITDISGRGVGMDAVRDSVEKIKGQVELDSTKGEGCRFQINLPLTLATTQVLLAELCGRIYGIPMEYVQTMVSLDASDIFTLEGHQTLLFQDDPVSVAPLAELLQLSSEQCDQQQKVREGDHFCIILKSNEGRLGVLVESVLDEQEVVIKPTGALLKRVPNVSGATILATGEVCMILNPYDLVRTVMKQKRITAATSDAEETEEGKTVLLVEDSMITRIQEKRILEGAGYTVVPAVDGVEGFEKLRAQHIDAVVADVNMPNMNGFELTEKIRSGEQYRDLPVILVTTLSRDEDRQRGLEAGANAFIAKGTFEQSALLDTLVRLIGEAQISG
ncbi:MAG: hybrid sensor histidine kinase/response regulator [Sedimenticola sp.]